MARIGDKKNPLNNQHGYSDRTAYDGINLADNERLRVERLFKKINYLCRESGFKVRDSIEVVDISTGHVWKGTKK